MHTYITVSYAVVDVEQVYIILILEKQEYDSQILRIVNLGIVLYYLKDLHIPM